MKPKKYAFGLRLTEELIDKIKEEARNSHNGNSSAYTERMIRLGMGLDKEFNRKWNLLEECLNKLDMIYNSREKYGT